MKHTHMPMKRTHLPPLEDRVPKIDVPKIDARNDRLRANETYSHAPTDHRRPRLLLRRSVGTRQALSRYMYYTRRPQHLTIQYEACYSLPLSRAKLWV